MDDCDFMCRGELRDAAEKLEMVGQLGRASLDLRGPPQLDFCLQNLVLRKL